MTFRTTFSFWVASAFMALSLTAQAQTNMLPFKATEVTLPNGLKVIVVPTGYPNLVSLQIPVQTGARNEVEPGHSGSAHFFEHMMFRGTKAYPSARYTALYAKAGGDSNAYTTDDYTNYYATFAKEYLDEVLRAEADRFQNLEYSVDVFKTESRAVLGEYNKNSANPLTKLFEVQRDRAFTTHPYKHTTLGFLKDIEDLPNQFEYSRQFFNRWYRPEYTTIVVAGDVQPDQVIALVTKYFSGWKRGTYKAQIPPEPKPTASVSTHVPWKTATLPWVTVAFRGPAFSESTKDFAAVDLLFNLAFGETSELHKRLVVQEQLVDRLWRSVPECADPPLMTVLGRLKQPGDALKVRDAMLQTFAQARTQLWPEARVTEARANASKQFLRQLDSTESIAATLAGSVRHRRAFDTLNNYYRVYATLTARDLQAAAQKYFTDESLVVTTLSHDPLPEGVAVLPPLKSFEAATAEEPVPFIERPSALPLLNIKLSFAVGAADDPPGKEGLAALTAQMISSGGSQRQSIDEIAAAFFPLAASFEAQVDKEVTRFTAVVAADDFERFSAVAWPMLLTPGFRAEAFQRLKEGQLNSLTNDLRMNNDEELARERLSATLFAGTPYGHPVLGTVAGVEAITLDDVKAFAAKYYTRARLVVGLAGRARPEVRAELQRAFSQLPPGEPVPPLTPFLAHRPKGLEVELIKKDTRATAISFGAPIEVTRSHPDFAALSVARSWLGEHRSPTSHLYRRIREERGLNYGDYAYIEALPRPGTTLLARAGSPRRNQIFEVWLRPVAPEHAAFALRIALYELEKLITHGLTREQFEASRAYLMQNTHLLTAKQDQDLGYQLDSRFYGQGEFGAQMRERLSALTVDDVNRAIRAHLSAKNLSVVMVAKDVEALKQAILAEELTPLVYDATKPRELLDEDRVIGAMKLGTTPDAVKVVPVEAVFMK